MGTIPARIGVLPVPLLPERPLLTLLLLACATQAPTSRAEAPPTPPATPEAAPPVVERTAPPPADTWTVPDARPVRRRPSPGAALRGVLAEGEAFRVLDHVDGDGCDDWARVEADGFACLDGGAQTDAAPVALPRLVPFDHPTPDEYASYVETGSWERTSGEALVPNLYAKRWRQWKGWLYADVDAFEAEEKPVGRLEFGGRYRFVRSEQTDRGEVVVNEDGRVAAVDDLFFYPISRHTGRDLEADPLPPGRWPAIVIDYDGAPLLAAPDEDAEELGRLPYHTPVEILDHPAEGTERWWVIPDALGDGRDAYVNDWRSIRHPVPFEPPPGVGPDEVWIDVELNQQVLSIHRGEEMLWFTVVATGAAPMGSPKGVYRITDKMIETVMQSRPDADEPYYVEGVPWVLHFKPRYALHGAYWHWGFGRTASHGCINLAPRDADRIFRAAQPALPDGWHTIYATPDDPGTVFRIRRGKAHPPGSPAIAERKASSACFRVATSFAKRKKLSA